MSDSSTSQSSPASSPKSAAVSLASIPSRLRGVVCDNLDAAGRARIRELSPFHKGELDETHTKACGFGFDDTRHRLVLAEAMDSGKYKVLLSQPRWSIFESTEIPDLVNCASARKHSDPGIRIFEPQNIILDLHKSLFSIYDREDDNVPCSIALTSTGGKFRVTLFCQDYDSGAYLYMRVPYNLYVSVCDSRGDFGPYDIRRIGDVGILFVAAPYIRRVRSENASEYAIIGFHGRLSVLQERFTPPLYDLFLDAAFALAWTNFAPRNIMDVKLQIAVPDIAYIRKRHQSKWCDVVQSRDYVRGYDPPSDWVEMTTKPMKLAIL
jgi:hypothetical protein